MVLVRRRCRFAIGSTSELRLAGGLLENAPTHFATEIAGAVNDHSTMHALPAVTGAVV